MGRLNEVRVESIVQLILDDYTDERAASPAGGRRIKKISEIEENVADE